MPLLSQVDTRQISVDRLHRRPTGLCLTGARMGLDATTAKRGEIWIEGGMIRELRCGSDGGERARKSRNTQLVHTIDLTGYLILPGLINAHDHLEFNLFPRMGNGPYPNAARWAEDIYRPQASPLREHLAVPKRVQLCWGGLKNLLSGATTVCHHNPYYSDVFDDRFPVRVVDRYSWAHSLQFDEQLAEVHHGTAAEVPFLLHAAEGTDPEAGEEIFELDRLGVLDTRTVIVHGVGLNATGRALLERRGGALVWCPTSNLFTLGKTLSREELCRHRRLALGTDSALTASGDLLDEIRAAYLASGLGGDQLYRMVTVGAADLLRLKRGTGTIRPGGAADLIAVPDRGEDPAETLMNLSHCDLELVLLEGRTQLLSPGLMERWPTERAEGLEEITVEGARRHVRAPVQSLLEEARKHLGDEIRLAGKRVLD